MRIRNFAAALLAAIALAGCAGEPRFDATSEATAKASTDKMSAGMTEPQKKGLAADMLAATMPDLQKAMAKGPGAALTLDARRDSRGRHTAG